jgi:MoaA/NifB/PqqE/SkfB family radical SAM enzyme
VAYCSNPLALDKAGIELDTANWLRVLVEASDLGVLQAAFSGGASTIRRDLEDLIARAALGLYSNLITAGVLLDEARLEGLIAAGLDHLQLSVQDARAINADRLRLGASKPCGADAHPRADRAFGGGGQAARSRRAPARARPDHRRAR